MYRIGVDLGGTNIAVGIVDEKYKIIAQNSAKTKKERGAKAIVKDIALLIEDLLSETGIKVDEICSAGIGVPGAVDTKKGVVAFSNNLDFYNTELKKMLKDSTGFDFFVANDANAAAFGEYIAGSGKGSDNFVLMTIGTGIGAGIVINGKIYTGVNGAAAEIGHTVIVKDGIPCSCGRKGCFERYASASALTSMAQKAAEENTNSELYKLCGGDIKKIEGRTVFAAIEKNDKTAGEVLDKFIEYLAVGVTDIVNALQPDVLAIGGGVSAAGDVLINPLKQRVQIEDYARFCELKTIIKAAVLSNDAGIIGAAYLDLT